MSTYGDRLDSIILEAIRIHPQIKTAEKNKDAAFWKKIKTYHPSSPKLFIEKEGFEKFSKINERETDKYGISQEIPFPVIWFFEIKNENNEYTILKLEEKKHQADLIYSILKEISKYHVLKLKLAVTDSLKNEIKILAEKQKKTFEVGEIPEAEYLRTEVEIIEKETMIEELKMNLKKTINRIEYLLNTNLNDKVLDSIAFPINLDYDSLDIKSYCNNFELKILKKKTDITKGKYYQSFFHWLPNLELEWAVNKNRILNSNENSFRFSFQFPLWFSGSPLSQIKISQNEKESKKYALESFRKDLLAQIQSIQLEKENLKTTIKNYQKKIIPYEKKIFHHTQLGYEKGEFSYDLFWNNYRSYYNTITAYYEQLQRYFDISTELDYITISGRFKMIKENSHE